MVMIWRPRLAPQVPAPLGRSDCLRRDLRIDHLLLSPALADRLVDAQVDRHVRGWEKTSDHAPVWIELADKPKRRRKPAASSQAGAPL